MIAINQWIDRALLFICPVLALAILSAVIISLMYLGVCVISEWIKRKEATRMETIPHSRSTDPISSYEAAEKTDAETDKATVYAALVNHLKARGFKPTSAELAKLSGLDRHMVGRRLPDLHHEKMVERSVDRYRKCRESKVTAYVWWV